MGNRLEASSRASTSRRVRAKRDGSSFELVSIAGLPVEPQGMDRAADGSLFVAVGGDSASPAGIVQVDPTTGEQHLVFEGIVAKFPNVGANGRIYASRRFSGGPVELDLESGTTKSLAPNLGGSSAPVLDLLVVPGEPAPPACRDGLDNDGDGRIDWPRDRGCTRADDPTEESDCADGLDNDRDGRIDLGEDEGCRDDGPLSLENPACDDGIDNDGDGCIDADDPECLGPFDDTEHWVPRFARSEQPPRCGLVGIEPVLLGLLAGVARRWRRRFAAGRAG